MYILIIIIQVLLAVLFLLTGIKIYSGKMAHEFKRFGYQNYFNKLTGSIELIGSLSMFLGVWINLFAFIGALILSMTMLAAAVTLLLIVRDPVKKAMPSVVLFLLNIIILIYYLPLII